ncbi:hypothetical protein Tco_1570771 [Tanacetum coccineum]
MDYEEGYYDSEGDALFLESLLCEDTTHNFAFKVISDHDTSISFSPRSDPLHHEFAGELLTLPSRNDREHEDYLNRVENDDSEDEDNELPNLDHQDNPSSPRPPPEPPDVKKCLKPEAEMKTCANLKPDGPNFKVNGHRVKHYFGRDLPPKEV